ncbi:hypothetical protein F8M41_026307 [Gigaspora margarita]|uniref:Uncharacterized protein n=1 Tax=Gigaspora margarita TaxID=4874 RepID=A0A8H3XH38_GIGMA|nr:hypothetical protein F8M41_026307 [Gigaspora margarita]
MQFLPMNLDSTLASSLYVSNTDELASGLDNMSFKLDNSNINLNKFEVDPTSNLLDDLETTINEVQEFFNEILNNSTYFEHICSFLDIEIDQKYEEFPNKAYTNLMVLVTKYKLSNMLKMLLQSHSYIITPSGLIKCVLI